jgi:hypothetical protein
LNKDLNVGSEVSVGHGWLNVPHQPSYVTKTAGKIDTSNLTIQSVILSGKFQVLDWKEHLLFLKPGFLILNLNHGWDSVDTDTGAVLALEIASGVGERNRFSVDVQAILSPTVRGKNEYDLSFGMVLGVHQLFRSKTDAEVLQPVRPAQVVAPEVKVVVPPAPKPEPIPQKVEPVTPPADPTPVSIPPVIVKHKATLKLGSDGKLSPESYPLIQRVIDAYKTKPSVVKIRHTKETNASQLAEEIKVWMVGNGVPGSDVSVELAENLDKPIRIDIQNK